VAARDPTDRACIKPSPGQGTTTVTDTGAQQIAPGGDDTLELAMAPLVHTTATNAQAEPHTRTEHTYGRNDPRKQQESRKSGVVAVAR
jgi:hypothetical protein